MNECMTQEDAERMDNGQAIAILKPLMNMMRDQYGCPISDAYFALDKAITALLQPQRKQGEWIEDGYSHYKAVCSECGEPCATYIMGKPRDKYCKWCGADMRSEIDQ